MMRNAETPMLLRTSSESNLRPISRFTAKTVASGLVIACRLAICPTSRSPASVKPTIEGVVRLPSELGITTGSPPSMTATHEFVVPRSMPITLAMSCPAFRSPRSSLNNRALVGQSKEKWSELLLLRLGGRLRRGSFLARLGDHHRCGAHQPVAQLVSARHLRHHGARGLLRFLRHERLVQVGIEGLAHGGEAGDAVLRQRAFEQLLHQPHAFDHLTQVVLLGVVERSLQVVGDGQEVPE